ncbi:class I poly(R)-hydroxyalkanoic acid synthase [Phormidium willei BDU 130791]|nr:class I poly(R)-hydroxyalkanoic acid synthase [Phormidium willei BDU 130791]
MADDKQSADVKLPDPVELSRAMAGIAERSQKLVSEFLERQARESDGLTNQPLDPLNIGSAFFDMTARLMTDPTKLMQAQLGFWQDYMKLWQSAAQRMMGQETDAVVEPERSDRRFRDPLWEESQLFDFIKQSYLLSARWIQATVNEVDGLDDKTAKKVDFYTRQFVDAMAPSNFVMTNPEVLRATMESGGENLVKGLENLLEDLERGKGKLNIRMTDLEAFKIGENIAVTEGQVVYQNELMQLIQYSPRTEQAAKRPLLVIPPWINKFYILDLREKNSFVKWAVEQGHTVFVISWVNPDETLARKTFEDYMLEGPFAAIDAIEQATGEEELNVIGYCLGGTLLAASLAYLSAKPKSKPGPDIARIKSATFFTTMTDFEEAGELGVFIDEEQLAALEQQMSHKGYLEGTSMATTFNMLRANDLIWSFVVNNYLLGKDPFPFDLLYWNSDSTRMPAAMHSFYLRRMYQENRLVKPGGIELLGVPLDLGQIKTPIFMLSTREDHIAPWKSTYALTQNVSGPIKFVLAASGHIAGVVNPPAAHKYCYWTNSRNPKDPDTWLDKASEHAGSWWPEWQKWIGRHAGGKVAARVPGDGKLTPIEPAPGSYVKVRSVPK